ncbi:hypothetical protein GCM10023093_27040 [Nemorincola caseinilytica]|uniref:YHYH protein n=1 Tax=Nemorincola caseinilytica TaxID=2054315 RepID=A0ABP8NPC5_9BACT
MKKLAAIYLPLVFCTAVAHAQTDPVITGWLFNTSGTTARYYITGNTTPQVDATLANVQQVRYSDNYVYVNATGVPSYVTGPYAIGTVAKALNNNYVIKLPRHPVAAPTPTAVGMGAIAVFINGTVAYAARDAATYMNMGQWHQNAVYFENLGFDCAHGHPGPMSADYHVHQNPSAYNVSAVPTSNICNVYLADGLYVPNSAAHGPLIGFASDGFPIYGAYGYTDPNDPSSPIKRMAPGYRLRSITSRTTLPDGTSATGPAFTDIITSPLVGSTPLPASLGAYEEDYEYVAGIGDLDEHNGRFCKTPEYPLGTYCYFATIDADRNPAFPYLIGKTYYGVAPASGPGSSFVRSTVSETVTTYTPTAVARMDVPVVSVSVFPNPVSDLLVVQCSVAGTADRHAILTDMTGRVVQQQTIPQGSTMCYFNVEILYAGTYMVTVTDGQNSTSSKVIIR